MDSSLSAAPRQSTALPGDASARLRLLVDAGAVLSAAFDTDDGLTRLAELLVEDQADYAITYLIEDGGLVRRVGVAHHRTTEEALVRELLTLPAPTLGSPGAGLVMATGRPVLAEEVTDALVERTVQDERHLEILRRLRPRSSIVVPLRARGRTLGAIAVATSEGGRQRYGPEDLDFLMELASRAALVVDNARLFEGAREELDRRRMAEHALRRQNEQLRVLTRLSEAIGRARGLDEIFQEALTGLLATLNVDRASILLFDADDVLRFKAWRGLSAGYRAAVEGHTPWSRDTLDPDPIAIDDVARAPDLGDELRATIRREGIAALAFIPLAFERALLGKFMIYSDTPRAFSPDDLDLALAVARNVAIAIARVRDAGQVAEARDWAEQANVAKSQFLAVMSHELRTPLNAILGYADLLDAQIDGQLGERQSMHVERIRASAEVLVELIDDVLVYARLEAGREELRLEETEIAPMLRAAASLVEPTCRMKHVDLVLDLPADPIRLTSDPGKLRQIVLNLLSNAVKFTDTGQVELKAGCDDGHVRIAVRDTGPGIAAADLERIFDAFTQGDPSSTRRKGGTGLGLAVCRRLATLLGGQVTVESEVGRGSTFTLTVPVLPPAVG